MKKVNVTKLSGVISAEAEIAKQGFSSMSAALDELSDDHPLKQEAARIRSAVDDLSKLPAGHPLLVAMEEARLRYEEKKERDRQFDLAKTDNTLKRAKRLNAKKETEKARRRQEDELAKKRRAANLLNDSISEAIAALGRLKSNATAASEDFAGNRYAEVQLLRISRILTATSKGLFDCTIKPGRFE